MKTSQMIQSKFLKKEDFPTPTVMTMRAVQMEKVGQTDQRWVLYFNENAKGIVLNATKIKQLEATFGDDTDRWIGRKIKVMNDPTVMMGHQVVGGIKFVMPNPGAGPATPPPPPPPVDPDFDDSIGF